MFSLNDDRHRIVCYGDGAAMPTVIGVGLSLVVHDQVVTWVGGCGIAEGNVG